MNDRPSAEVVREFGWAGEPQRLAGGEGRTWRVEQTIFKQVDPVNAEFEAALALSLPQVGYRLAKPRRTTGGTWTLDGWAAYTFLPGECFPGEHLEEKLAASRSFHRDLGTVPCSTHLDDMQCPWTIAQHIAFGKHPWEADQRIATLLRSFSSLNRASLDTWQIVHADIAGNFLLEQGKAPAIIDLTLKWSPAGFAEAVMAVDVSVWEGVPLQKVLPLLHPQEAKFVPLAAMRRILEMDTLCRIGGRPESIFDQVPHYEAFAAQYATYVK